MRRVEEIQREFSPADYFATTNAIEKAVRLSARRHPLLASMKDQEIKRRIGWCIGQALALRRLGHWSVERICDTLPTALDTYLTTGDWQPPERRIWSADE